MSSMQLGRVQLLVMQVLWSERRATARQITDAINEIEPIAHSTVQTLLRGLEEKGSISHEIEGRTFVFFPLVEEVKYKQKAIRDLLDRVFSGNVGKLVTHLLKNEKLSKEETDEIRKLINRRSREVKGDP